jgi:NADH:ubiquinone oxidoreductase subunit 6 (subunit J)
MDEATKKAFDFAADLTKQLITVASAIVTLTVTFSKDTPAPARGWAYAAWFCFLFSILLGFGALMGMTGELQPKANHGVGKTNPSIWKGNITALSGLQVFVFLVAIFLTTRFGMVAMQSSRAEQAQPTPQVCNCVLSQPQAAVQPATPQPKQAPKEKAR